MNNDENFSFFSEYKEKHIPSTTKFFHNNFVKITRIFDDQLKSFINHIFKYLNIANYAYRIKFQAKDEDAEGTEDDDDEVIVSEEDTQYDQEQI